MNNVEKTKVLVNRGMVVPINPAYLSKLPDQQEKSLLGQRTLFLAFNRFMFNLPDKHVYRLSDEYKKTFLQAQKDFPDEICCDLSLMYDAIQYQIAVRDDRQGDPAIVEEIAISWRENCNIAKEFDEITSDYLIDLAKKWLN